jgi:hypothetical protein
MAELAKNTRCTTITTLRYRDANAVVVTSGDLRCVRDTGLSGS